MNTSGIEAAQQALLRQVAADHGVPLDRGDPILVLHTAILRIISDALEHADTTQRAALEDHQTALEEASARMHQSTRQATQKWMHDIRTTSRSAIEEATDAITMPAVRRQRALLDRHGTAVRWCTLACGAAMCVAVTAAALVLVLGQ